MSPEQIPVIVFDSVGFVRLVLNPDGPWGAIFAYSRTGYRVGMSEQLASELVDVLSRSKIRERFDAGPVARANIHHVLETAIWVELSNIPKVCRDPKDDMIIETARVAGADFIATEDNDLLDMVEHDGIRIVTGIELLTILRR